MSAEAWDGHRRGDRNYHRLTIALFAAGVATFAQLYSVQAVLPGIARSFEVSPTDAALAVSVATAGVTLSVLPWAFLADRIGRARSMTIAIIVATLFGLLAPMLPTFELFLAFRFAEGLALGALPALAVAYLSEEVNSDHVAIAAATYVSGTTIGGLTGRLVAGPMSEVTDWRQGMAANAIIAAVAAVVFITVAPRSRGFLSVRERRARGLPVPRAAHILGRHLRDPALLAIFAQSFLLMGVLVAVYNFISFRLEAPPFSIPVALVSLIFLAYLAGTWSSRLAGRLSGRWGRYRTLMASALAMTLGTLVTTVDQVPSIVAGLVILTAGFFAAHAVASAWIAQRAPVGTAQASALYTLTYYAGSSIIGWLIGFVFTPFGWTLTAVILAGLCGVAMVIARLVLKDADSGQ